MGFPGHTTVAAGLRRLQVHLARQHIFAVEALGMFRPVGSRANGEPCSPNIVQARRGPALIRQRPHTPTGAIPRQYQWTME